MITTMLFSNGQSAEECDATMFNSISIARFLKKSSGIFLKKIAFASPI